MSFLSSFKQHIKGTNIIKTLQKHFDHRGDFNILSPAYSRSMLVVFLSFQSFPKILFSTLAGSSGNQDNKAKKVANEWEELTSHMTCRMTSHY